MKYSELAASRRAEFESLVINKAPLTELQTHLSKTTELLKAYRESHTEGEIHEELRSEFPSIVPPMESPYKQS